MGRILLKGSFLLAASFVGAVACTTSSTSSTPSVAPSSAGAPPATIPAAKTVAEPATYGYYDGHIDAMLSTDVSSKSQAVAMHVNYSAALVTQSPAAYPSLYTIVGHAASDQPVVFGSEPGESDYSPLWQEVTVQWKPGVTPVLLVKDDQVKALAASGKLTVTPTPVVLNCPIVNVG